MGFFARFFSRFTGGNKRESNANVQRRLADIQREREYLSQQVKTAPPPPSRLGDRLDRIRTERLALEQTRSDQQSSDPLLNGQWVPASGSSNVASFRYVIDEAALEVEFLDGSMYRYFNVPAWKAKSFFSASSKGKAVWDYLRIRGTKLGHQHDYVMMLGPTRGHGKAIAPGFGTRKWERTPKTAKRHAKVVERQSSGPGGYAAKKTNPNWEAAKRKGRG